MVAVAVIQSIGAVATALAASSQPSSFSAVVDLGDTTTTTTTETALQSTTTPYITATTVPSDNDPFEDPLKQIIYATIFLAMLSLVSSVFVIVVFFLQSRRSSTTVLRNSLNYLWIAGLACMALESIEGVVSNAIWVVVGNDAYLQNKAACVVGTVVHDFLRTALAGFLLAYYVHIYIVRKYDEPRAIKALPYYVGAALCLAAAVAIFSAVELPRAFDRINRCEGNLVSLSSAVPVLVPVVIEMGIVVAGLVAAFNLLCSDSRVTTASSKRRVVVHVVFMVSLFAARAITSIVTVTRSSDSGVPDRFSSLPTAAQIAYVVSSFHNWSMGLIMSLVFGYSECLLFVVRRMMAEADADAESLTGDKLPVSFSQGNSSRRRGDSVTSDIHVPSLVRPFARTPAGIVEDHLQAYTLSYTVRASSLYADGALPPSGYV